MFPFRVSAETSGVKYGDVGTGTEAGVGSWQGRFLELARPFLAVGYGCAGVLGAEPVDGVTSFPCLALTGGVTRRGERWETRLRSPNRPRGLHVVLRMAGKNQRVYA